MNKAVVWQATRSPFILFLIYIF